MGRRTLLGSSLCETFAIALVSTVSAVHAAADTSVTVWLKNGGVIQGELVELMPNSHITLTLATGEVRRIVWDDIDHDSLGASKPKPSPAADDETIEDDAAHKPNPKSKAVSDYVPPDVSKAAVITGADGYLLQRLEGTFSGSGSGSGGHVHVSGEVWKTICVAPCNQALPPGMYRVDGDGIPTSRSFTLGGNERVEVSPGSSVGFYGGRTLFLGGLFLAIIGGIIYGREAGQNDDIAGLGKAGLIGGGTAAVLGLPLWLLSGTRVTVAGPSGASRAANAFQF